MSKVIISEKRNEKGTSFAVKGTYNRYSSAVFTAPTQPIGHPRIYLILRGTVAYKKSKPIGIPLDYAPSLEIAEQKAYALALNFAQNLDKPIKDETLRTKEGKLAQVSFPHSKQFIPEAGENER